MLLLCLFKTLMALRGEAYELFTDPANEEIVVTLHSRFIIMKKHESDIVGTQVAIFRPQGNKLFVDKDPICARKVADTEEDLEICRNNEEQDQWELKERDPSNSREHVIMDVHGEKCVGYRTVPFSGKDASPILMVVACDDPEMEKTFFPNQLQDVHDTSSQDNDHHNYWENGDFDHHGHHTIYVDPRGKILRKALHPIRHWDGDSDDDYNFEIWGLDHIGNHSHRTLRKHHVGHLKHAWLQFPTHVHNL